MNDDLKEYTVTVVCYQQKCYTILAKTLEEAKERYAEGEYDSVREGGVLDGELVNEEWDIG